LLYEHVRSKIKENTNIDESGTAQKRETNTMLNRKINVLLDLTKYAETHGREKAFKQAFLAVLEPAAYPELEWYSMLSTCLFNKALESYKKIKSTNQNFATNEENFWIIRLFTLIERADRM
jgi:hypothetical protein